MFSELVARNSRRSRRENGLFFTSLLISIVAFYIILSLSHQDVMVFLQRMESSAVDRLLSLVPVLYGLTLFILFFLVYYANRFQLARRRHEFGVYLMLGMQRRKLFGMLLAEDLRSSLIALAIGLPHEVAHGSLRLSVGEYNTDEEMAYIVDNVRQVVAYLRSISPVWDELETGARPHLI